MRTITGVFRDVERAHRAVERLRPIAGDDAINLLVPHSAEGVEERRAQKRSPDSPHRPDAPEDVPRTEDMPPVGKQMGAILGGALGAGLGLMLPGVGQITAVGLGAAALLGGGGAAAGYFAGREMDRVSSQGLPVDELFVYEDALRQGRTVVFVTVKDRDLDVEVERVLEVAGAESIDQARHDWWLGLRDAERAHYEADGGDFDGDEPAYRAGFESALHPDRRGTPFAKVRDDLSRSHPAHAGHPAFERGYGRGRAHLGTQPREQPPRERATPRPERR